MKQHRTFVKLQNRFNKSFDFGQNVTKSDLMKAGSTHGYPFNYWLYECIERSDICPTSFSYNMYIYFVKTELISHNREDLGKQLSSFDSLWILMNLSQQIKIRKKGGQYLMRKLDSNIPPKVQALVKTVLCYFQKQI